MNQSSCQCCLNNAVADKLFLDTQVCANTTQTADCYCASNNTQCSCSVGSVTYRNFNIRNQSCLYAKTSFGAQARCCLHPHEHLVPKVSNCSASTPANGCNCVEATNAFTRQPYLQCSCSNRTGVTNQTPSSCNCLSYTNGTANKNECGCCIPNNITCAVNSTVQDCQCSSSGNNLNCTCLRSDNNATRAFSLNRTLCQCSPADLSCKCCINPAQRATQLPPPVLTCAADQKIGNCACTNNSINTTSGTKSWNWSCLCRNNDFLTSLSANFAQGSCLSVSGNLAQSQCCLTAAQADQLIPKIQCQNMTT